MLQNFSMRTGLRLWWRGLREARRSRWLFWFFPIAVVVFYGVLLLQITLMPALRESAMRSFHAHSWVWYQGFTLPVTVGLWAIGSSATHFDIALTRLRGFAVLAALLLVLVHAWRRTLLTEGVGHRQRRREGAVAACLTVLVATSSVGLLLAGYFRSHVLARAVLLAALCWPAAAAAVLYAGFGELFLSYVAGRRLNLERAYQHVIDRFFRLFVFFLIFLAPWVWSALVRGSYVVLQPPVKVSLASIRLAALALPFLIAAKGLGLVSATRTLPRFYKDTWRMVVALVAITLLPMALVNVAWWAVFSVRPIEDRLLVEALRGLFFLPKVLVSLGGIAGMFLLVNGWQTEPEDEGFDAAEEPSPDN